MRAFMLRGKWVPNGQSSVSFRNFTGQLAFAIGRVEIDPIYIYIYLHYYTLPHIRFVLHYKDYSENAVHSRGKADKPFCCASVATNWSDLGQEFQPSYIYFVVTVEWWQQSAFFICSKRFVFNLRCQLTRTTEDATTPMSSGMCSSASRT